MCGWWSGGGYVTEGCMLSHFNNVRYQCKCSPIVVPCQTFSGLTMVFRSVVNSGLLLASREATNCFIFLGLTCAVVVPLYMDVMLSMKMFSNRNTMPNILA